MEESDIIPLRSALIKKLTRSRDAWTRSIFRFRSLHWLCVIGIVCLTPTLAGLKNILGNSSFTLLSVTIAVLGAVQAGVKPGDKFLRDIEFRDEADYYLRLAQATNDQQEIIAIHEKFELIERRFHQGEHPWPMLPHGQPEYRQPTWHSIPSKGENG